VDRSLAWTKSECYSYDSLFTGDYANCGMTPPAADEPRAPNTAIPDEGLVVFVDPANGNDSGGGSVTSPVRGSDGTAVFRLYFARSCADAQVLTIGRALDLVRGMRIRSAMSRARRAILHTTAVLQRLSARRFEPHRELYWFSCDGPYGAHDRAAVGRTLHWRVGPARADGSRLVAARPELPERNGVDQRRH